MKKKLYVVATPIGNLGDITLRALEVLKETDLVIAEDSRVSVKILNHYKIKKPIAVFHEHSRPEIIASIFKKIPGNGSAAILCDAGTPGISDPGGKIVEAALTLGFEVHSIPGASAITAALSVYGKRIPGFTFIGFIPKKGKTKTLNFIRESENPVIFYESPKRIIKVLHLLLLEIGDRDICICRELTKKFETIYRGKISEIIPQIKEKGEFVVIIEGTNGKK